MFSSFYFTFLLKKTSVEKRCDPYVGLHIKSVFISKVTMRVLLYSDLIPCVKTLSGQIVLSVKEDLHIQRLYTCPPSASMVSLLMLQIKPTSQFT